MKSFVVSILTLLLISCSSKTETSSNPNKSPFEAGGSYDQALEKELESFKKEEDSIRKANADKLTDVEFSIKTHDFGKIKAESKNEYFFVLTNTGKKPLVIESVRASCGCTTPIKPSKPILPGHQDSIKVLFSPFPGMRGHVEKTITVKSNTYIPVNELFISGTVE